MSAGTAGESGPTSRITSSTHSSLRSALQPSYSVRQSEVGRQPDRKRLGEILVRVLLRVPAEDVPHVVAREWIGGVALAIRPRVVAEVAARNPARSYRRNA